MTIKVFENGYVTDEVSTIKPYEANTSEENRIKFVTDCAAISRGKTESNNPKKRYEHLLKEAAPNECGVNCEGVAGRPFEFLPIVITESELQALKAIYWFEEMAFYRFAYYDDGFKDGVEKYYTNARVLLNLGVDDDYLPFNTEDELKYFKVVKVKAPYFVFAQIRTHCMISQIAASARVIEENEIWLPDDFEERLEENWGYCDYIAMTKGLCIPSDVDDKAKFISSFIKKEWRHFSVYALQNLFKKLGYKREIWQRYPQHALYKTWVMAGWLNDPKVWNHFFLERGVFDDKYKNWVQPETKQIAKAIYKVIMKGK